MTGIKPLSASRFHAPGQFARLRDRHQGMPEEMLREFSDIKSLVTSSGGKEGKEVCHD